MPEAKIDRDYCLWIEEQVNNLKQKHYDRLDLPNLIEELEALGRNEKNAVKSFTYQILLHLLLLDNWYEECERNKNHWRAEIDTFQFQLSDRLTSNLKNYLEVELDYIYSKARKTAIDKSGVESDRFPEQREYSLNDIIGEDS